MNDITDKLNYCMEFYKPMGSFSNLFNEYLVLKEHNPKKIIEIGVGAAGWALTINDLLNNSNLEFDLIEDFRETNYPGFEWWPTNKTAFDEYIKEKNKHFKYSLNEEYSKIENGDVLRFDAWGVSLKEIESILANLSFDAIVIFDDFSFNKDLDLIVLVLELVKKKLIYPIWASNTVSGWSKSKYYSKQMITHLQRNKDLIETVTKQTVCYKNINTVLDINFELIQFK
jgi:hypothetical protein